MPVSPFPPTAPFHFGAPEDSLFGCYHEPPRGRRRKCAILICPPAGHEYINCHRALRQLATRLSQAGFPVLRFDYYGCGDSSGDAGEGTLQRWLEDIVTAVSELRRRSGLAQICVVGLRLGATLAMIAGAQQDHFESLVLWDPIVDGRSHLEELLCLQKEMSRFRPRPKTGWKPSECIEVLGFPVPPALHTELEKINLLTVTEAPAKNVLIVESYGLESYRLESYQLESQQRERRLPDSGPPFGATALKDHLSQSLTSLEYQRLDSPQVWLPVANGSLLVPFPLLQSVVSWACRTHL